MTSLIYWHRKRQVEELYNTLFYNIVLIFCFNSLFSSCYFSFFAICSECVSGYVEWKPLKGEIIKRPGDRAVLAGNQSESGPALMIRAQATSSPTDFWITYIGISKEGKINKQY